MDRQKFYAALQSSGSAVFGTKLTQAQVDGMNDLLDAWDAHGDGDSRKLAYCLASTYKETGGYMLPVKETVFPSHKDKNPSDETVAARLEKAWNKGVLTWVKTPYWRKDAGGHYWFGRGRVQNTHKANYVKLQERFGHPFTTNPGLLLNSRIDAVVTVVGHMKGIWTGSKLSDFFNNAKEDWDNARKIVNPGETGSYKEVGNFGRAFLKAIQLAGGVSLTASGTPAAPEPISVPEPLAAALTYTVRSGDTLSGIATQHGVSVEELIIRNSIADANLIQVGQVLQIRAP